MANIEFSLDGETVKARPGETILDVARRKGLPAATVERWLAANLGYDDVAA